MLEKAAKRLRRKARVRSQISGTASIPRMSVFRSNKNIYVQVVDDVEGKTLCAFSDLRIKEGTNTEKATKVGDEIAKLAIALKIDTIKFDRGWFSYKGRVKALADAARNAGLKF